MLNMFPSKHGYLASAEEAFVYGRSHIGVSEESAVINTFMGL